MNRQQARKKAWMLARISKQPAAVVQNRHTGHYHVRLPRTDAGFTVIELVTDDGRIWRENKTRTHTRPT